MIDVYTWPTPNGHKVHIMLEECGLEHTIHGVNIRKGEQFSEDFLKISPNNRIPAIVDQVGPEGEPYTLFESGAILIYLAEKTNKFLPRDGRARHDTLQWLMFQMANIGPMLGQAHHFRHYANENIQYAINRYTNEASKIYAVLDAQLGKSQYIAGEDYSIADIAIYPWLRPQKMQGQDISHHPNIQRWYNTMRARPAIKRGLLVMHDKVSNIRNKPVGDAWKTLFDRQSK